MNIVIGNIIALIASALMVYAGILKEKKKILYVQIIQAIGFIISNIVLGGISGAILNTIACIRNILCYKDKLGFKERIIIIVLSIALTLVFNNLGIIGILPLVSTVVYIWGMNTKDVIKFKFLMIFTMVMWFIHDFYIKSYTSSFFNLMNIIMNGISIIQIKNENKQEV